MGEKQPPAPPTTQSAPGSTMKSYPATPQGRGKSWYERELLALVDELLPLVPVRQFVVTFPVQLSLWMARSKSLCAKVCEKVCAELTAHLQAASVAHRIAFGPNVGQPVRRLKSQTSLWPSEQNFKSNRTACVSAGGYSVCHMGSAC